MLMMLVAIWGILFGVCLETSKQHFYQNVNAYNRDSNFVIKHINYMFSILHQGYDKESDPLHYHNSNMHRNGGLSMPSPDDLRYKTIFYQSFLRLLKNKLINISGIDIREKAIDNMVNSIILGDLAEEDPTYNFFIYTLLYGVSINKGTGTSIPIAHSLSFDKESGDPVVFEYANVEVLYAILDDLDLVYRLLDLERKGDKNAMLELLSEEQQMILQI